MKDIKIYRQRKDTCAIACLLMTLEYYKVIEKANWYDERRLYNIYRSKYMIGTPFSALAFHFAKNGLKTTIYHAHKNLFSNENNILSDDDFYKAIEEYKMFLQMAETKGAKVINGIEINSKLIKEKLQEGNIVILAGELAGGFHAILISDYENDSFIVCDPLYKNKQIKIAKELDEFMNTSIGKWFITVGDKSN